MYWKSWGQVVHSSLQRLSNPIPAGKTPWSLPAHPHGRVGAALEVPHPWTRHCPLATLTKAPETHSRTWRTKTNPKRRDEFPCGRAENGSSDVFHLFSLLCVRMCYDANLFLACSLFFMLSFLHDPSDYGVFSQISADFSIFCGGFLSNSVHKTVQGIFLCNSSSWVDFLQTYLSGSSIKNSGVS